MIFGLLNHGLNWNRPQRFLHNKVFFPLPSLTLSIPTNYWIHCNAYKHSEMPAFMASLHFHTCHSLENLLNQAKLQNLHSRIKLGSSSDCQKVFICPIWTLFGHFREELNMTDHCLPSQPFLINRFIGVLP